VAYLHGTPAGFAELEIQEAAVELASFGLLPAFIGRGLGPRLLEAAVRRGIRLSLSGDNSPADVAIQVWLQAARLLEELHAENHTIAQKNFCGFAGSHTRSREFPQVTEQTLQALQRDLDDTFEDYERGRGCRVFIFDRGRKVWIMVRRGATFRREESMKDGGRPGVQFYRPLMYDVLVYDTEVDDLGLHVETKWQARLYLRCIGQHIFSDPEYFPAARKLIFDPIIKHGPSALYCGDVSGMREVKLVEVNKKWNNAQHEIDIKKADDIFALGDRGRSFLRVGTLTKLVFRVWFEGVDKPRLVTLRWPNVTKYERDSDSELIDEWLRLRGFIKREEQERDAAD
jgi:GNAT superfamily N-acetyltransferase